MSKSLIYNNYIKFVRIYYIVNHIVSLLVAIIGIFEIVDDQSDPNFCKTKYDAYFEVIEAGFCLIASFGSMLQLISTIKSIKLAPNFIVILQQSS